MEQTAEQEGPRVVPSARSGEGTQHHPVRRVRGVRRCFAGPTRIAAAGLAALAVLGGCGVQDYAQPTEPCAVPTQAVALSEQLFRLINLERTLADLDPLSWDEELAKVAQGYACRMVEADFFGHIDRETNAAPHHRLAKAGYAFVVMGENLASGQSSAAEVVEDWIASPGHRDNVLSPEWTHIGIGVRTDEDGTLRWVVEFADPV